MEIDELETIFKNRSIPPSEFLAELWKTSEGHEREASIQPAGKLVLYRTRTFKEKSTPSYVHDLSYPPISKCKPNRANEQDEQVFYASAGLPTTLRESRVNTGEYIIVSKWRNTMEMILQTVGLTANPTGLEKLYHDIFTDPDESIYPYSSQIAKHLMQGNPPYGLLYPSIINKNQSHNVVLPKQLVDERLEFRSASLYHVTNITDDSKFDITEIDSATKLDDGRLDWKGRRKQWTLPPGGKMISNGWDWEAFLPDGTYVDPT